MAHMLGMMTLEQGVQLRTVSKMPSNRFVLPENKPPWLDSAFLSDKQITAVLASTTATFKTLQQSLWLTRLTQLKVLDILAPDKDVRERLKRALPHTKLLFRTRPL